MHVHAVVQPPLPSSPNDPQLDLDNRPLPLNYSSEPLADLEPGTGPLSDLTHLYVDPFNNATPTSLSRMQSQLQFIAPNATRAQKASYLLPASPRSLLIRSAHNIVRSVQSIPFDTAHRQRAATSTNGDSIDISIYDAAYAALFALVMFPSSPQGLASSLSDLRQHYAHHFIEDLRNYTNHILPLTSGLGAFGGDRGVTDPLVNLIRNEDITPKKFKRRSDIRPSSLGEYGETAARQTGEEVRYHVGTVFRHHRQGYTAVIYGWDSKCEMEERWILGNSVDRLPKGRGQPFYNAL